MDNIYIAVVSQNYAADTYDCLSSCRNLEA